MIPNLEQTFRWFGPGDPVTLSAIKQTGATGIVTALHQIPVGEVWGLADIFERKEMIENAGLRWSVVESVNVHEQIKTAGPKRDELIENYLATLKNLVAANITTVCYNFMPVLDWTRTNLDYLMPDGTSALRYEAAAMAAFDLYILEREGASAEYSPEQQKAAKRFLESLSREEAEQLSRNIMAGVPGTNDVYGMADFKAHLARYADIDAVGLKANLKYFLQAVIPEAEKAGVKLCIHPDDPPFPILGLPRVVSTEEDLQFVVNASPSSANGLTFCTGSLGARADNDLPGMIERLGGHIHFLHLRNVKREADGSFFEDNHLEGSTDMFAVMKALVLEQQKRAKTGREDVAIPMRPDHGHKMLDDVNYNTFPGYSVTGRMKGLAELRGLEMGVKRSLEN
ncbi:mannonate dehydratase [Mucilaginibacter ginkgonis]|uniref:Mannonate dehydratase n=1 Tax=Mucilaginibacter ginkgonis TaxID=2682091 RepID=A0A6I4HYL3_9SPHI|nr:mannonate dehydratase [Mucilaginibacter ginkgonis]QQL50443.1 mannonate dehydratase [Mucilaginibacter ginkgonis]